MNQLKREALLLIAGNLAPEEVAGLRAIFKVPVIDVTTMHHTQWKQMHHAGCILLQLPI